MPKTSPGPKPREGEPGREAVHVVDEAAVGQHAPRGAVDEGRLVAARGGVGEDERVEGDVGDDERISGVHGGGERVPGV